jgi:hypothetical protein
MVADEASEFKAALQLGNIRGQEIPINVTLTILPIIGLDGSPGG